VRAEELLLDLDATQRAAVTEPVVPLAILAPAGSGKTRALTRRIAWQAAVGNLDPNHVLAVTFTRKAAGELRGRLSRLGVRGSVTAGTFQRGRPRPAPAPPRGCGDRDAGAARPQGPAAGPAARRSRPRRGAGGLDQRGRVRDRVGQGAPDPSRRVCRAGAAHRAGYAALPPASSRRSTPRTNARSGRRGCSTSTTSSRPAPTRWRPIPRSRRRNGGGSVTSSSTSSRTSPARSSACCVHGSVPAPTSAVVGDPDQAIYAFAGADAGLLDPLRRLVRGGDGRPPARQLPLDPADRHPPPGPCCRSSSGPRSGPRCVEGPAPTITAYPTDADEARGVAEALYQAKAHDPRRPWSSMAVLYRVNAQSAPFEEALTRAGVPYRVRGAAAFLDRPEVKTVIEALRKGAKTAPGRTFAEHLTDLVSDANDLSEDRREHVDAVAALGREYLAAEGSMGSVKGFLDYLHASLRGGWTTVGLGRRRGWTSSPSTGQGTRVGHRLRQPASSAGWCRSRTRAGRPTRSTRNDGCCTSRSAGPSGICTCRGPRSAPGARVSRRERRARTSTRSRGSIDDSPAVVETAADRTRGPAGARQRLAALEQGEIPMSDRPLYDALGDLAPRARACRGWSRRTSVLDNKTLRNVATRRPRFVRRAAGPARHGPGEARALRRGAPGGGRPHSG